MYSVSVYDIVRYLGTAIIAGLPHPRSISRYRLIDKNPTVWTEEYQLIKKRLFRPKLRADVKNLELCIFSEAKTVNLHWTDLGLAFSWPIWGPRLNGSKTKICENLILRHLESWDWYRSLENLKPVLRFYQLQKCLYIYIIRHDKIQDVYYQ